MQDRPPVFAVTGQLSAGKTTVARALLDRCPFGFHIDVDGIREMVTSGLASPLEWTDETSRQFELAVRGSATLAAVYADAGFAVAIEGAYRSRAGRAGPGRRRPRRSDGRDRAPPAAGGGL